MGVEDVGGDRLEKASYFELDVERREENVDSLPGMGMSAGVYE